VTSRLELRGIRKQYPGCIANDDIHLAVAAGECHALLGENGAGKSTLMKIIYGIVAADAGTLLWEGTPTQIRSPAHARELGIGMVFQHFSLFETLTVAENIALSLPKDQTRNRRALSDRIRQVSEHYGMALDPDRYVHSLSVGARQRVEIVRCLLQDIRLLILDEPTSVLTPQEVEQLFITLNRLKAEGCAILFISHKLDEVRALCDQATVLRNGKVTGHCEPKSCDSMTLARLMVGDETPLEQGFSKQVGGEAVLIVKPLSLTPVDPFGMSLKDVSFDVKKGEILGIAGVAGNGQEELMAVLSGEDMREAGEVILNGDVIGKLSASQRRELGFAFVPEERLGRGAVPNMSLTDNTLLSSSHCGLLNNGWIRQHEVNDFAEAVISDFNVKCAGTHAQAKSLSGGNLQKFIIGREIRQQPNLLVCSHPTWGVDIGAAILIRKALIELRDQGAAILVISEDIDELYEICDRLGALCDGRLSPIQPTHDVSIGQLGQWMAGEFSDQQEQCA